MNAGLIVAVLAAGGLIAAAIAAMMPRRTPGRAALAIVAILWCACVVGLAIANQHR